MQRLTIDSAGRQWSFGWSGWADASGASRARVDQRKRWSDYIELDPGCVDIGDSPAVLVVILVVVLAIWLGPGMIALVWGLGELLFVVLGAAGVFVWRTLMRRPLSRVMALAAIDGQ